jgi:hypothetical protein
MAAEESKRKLAAILSADVKSYSRLMGAHEVGIIPIRWEEENADQDRKGTKANPYGGREDYERFKKATDHFTESFG